MTLQEYFTQAISLGLKKENKEKKSLSVLLYIIAIGSLCAMLHPKLRDLVSILLFVGIAVLMCIAAYLIGKQVKGLTPDTNPLLKQAIIQPESVVWVFETIHKLNGTPSHKTISLYLNNGKFIYCNYKKEENTLQFMNAAAQYFTKAVIGFKPEWFATYRKDPMNFAANAK